MREGTPLRWKRNALYNNDSINQLACRQLTAVIHRFVLITITRIIS